MSEPLYDFRDGILLEKVVYKDTSCNFGYVLLYLACLLLTWIWGSAWFALFFYSYIYHEKVAFIVFLSVWGAFAIIVIVIGFITIQSSKNQKAQKARMKQEREMQLKAIHDAKKRRNENQRNNFDEINGEESSKDLRPEVLRGPHLQGMGRVRPVRAGHGPGQEALYHSHAPAKHHGAAAHGPRHGRVASGRADPL